MTLPCAQSRLPSPPTIRPSWYGTGTPIVSDPKYGDLELLPCPRPLRCYKSEALPDGSYWMWLGGPWYRTMRSPLSGMLFFATSWEYWVLLQYQSRNDDAGTSVWVGNVGTGRVNGKQITIAALP